MNCPNCGKENADNFRYCQFCGTALSNSAILKVVENGETLDDLPQSTTSDSVSLDTWLLEDQGNPGESSGKGSSNNPSAKSNPSTPDDGWFVNEPSESATDNDVISEKDMVNEDELPLLDENNASLIPVDISFSGLRISEEAKQKYVAAKPEPEPVHLEDIPSGLSRLIELSDSNVRHGSERICPQCGAKIAEGHRFCGNCGTRYESGYDYTPADSRPVPKEISQSDSKRVAVERMTFVQGIDPSSPVQSDIVPFTLCHINDNGSEGEYIPLTKGENIIGRNSTPQLCTDRYINLKHLRLTCTDSHIIVEDFNSLNGVFYRLSNESVILRNGDIFRIGEELLCYFHGSTAQPLLSNQSNEQTDLLGGEEAPGWGYLRIVMGAFAEGSVYRLWQPTISLGRTHANILFPKDGFVSGTHATLKGMKDYAILTDLDSSNGTFVRIKAPLKVTKTTFILIGNQLLRIQPR